VIGGLIQERDSNIQSKVPWLGDIPYAGILFQRRQVVKSRSEIIVTLVPHVQPYTPIVACREQHALMRTQQPLITGPLCRVPRPFEPRLPDTFTNPKWGILPGECRDPWRPPYRAPLTNLPPMFDAPELAKPRGDVDPSAPDIPMDEARRSTRMLR
ncbi:hypothetical protein OAS39_06025, partial [Pirellulales bacterium]|nr:hypothetical protein [Pirellulales bacterium]